MSSRGTGGQLGIGKGKTFVTSSPRKLYVFSPPKRSIKDRLGPLRGVGGNISMMVGGRSVLPTFGKDKVRVWWCVVLIFLHVTSIAGKRSEGVQERRHE